MVSIYMIVFAAAGAAAEPTICKFNGGGFSCAVPGVKDICCTAANAMLPCLEAGVFGVADCKTAKLEKLAGPLKTAKLVDASSLADEAYLEENCPVITGLLGNEQTKKYCSPATATPTTATTAAEPAICYLNGDDFSCAVPGVKDICCTVAKAMLPCVEAGGGGVERCKAAELEKLDGNLQAAKLFDASSLADEAYLRKNCPVITGLLVDEAQKKMYCSPKQTCNFTGSMGLLKYDCSVQNTEKPCCDLTIALSACGEDEECITKVFLETEGFDIVKMQDPAYAKSRCPVLAELGGKEKKAAMHRDCKIDMGNTLDSSLLRKSECSIATDEFHCTVPDVKDICCKVAKAVLPCGIDAPESAKCRADLLSGELLPQLQAAGVGSYTPEFCPGIEGVKNKKQQEEYCTLSQAAATSSLFLLFNDALTSAPDETNMAFGVLCVVAVVASLAVVTRRRWQATSVETHEPLSHRIACHANEVELQAE